MTIEFLNLTISKKEQKKIKIIEDKIIQKLENFFEEEYNIKPQIRCTGSTNKGTALPQKYFGIDIDVAVNANYDLVRKVCYESLEFEGCQVISLDFFKRFTKKFGESYFAGHRITGKFQKYNFDFSMADYKKDRWKWDYNNSKYLKFSKKQINEVQKLKFFLKSYNVSGSQVNGIVGPAAELLIYHHKTFNKVLSLLSKLKKFPNNPKMAFVATPFPNDFYSLFPVENNYIHKGLVKSFKLTNPNTYNRLIDSARFGKIDIKSFIKQYRPKFSQQEIIPNKNIRAINYLIKTILQSKQVQMEILAHKNGYRIFLKPKNGNSSIHLMFKKIKSILPQNEIKLLKVPKLLKEDINSKLVKEVKDYIIFIGSPQFPLKEQVYIPIDFLMRENAQNLVKVMTDGQLKAR